MISTNGKPHIDHRAELAAKRRSNRILVESIREKRLQRIAAVETRRDRLYESMTVDWVSPYLDMLDRYRRDPEFSGPSSYWQRRKGRNYPIFQSEQELALLRAPARVLCSVSSYAIGMLEGLTSYVIGSGYTYRPAKRKRERSNSEEMAIEALADACQVVIDDFIEDNEWYGGEQPSIEEEFLWRSCEDGESILVHYDVGDGKTEVRTAEPEQLTCPPGESSIGDWSFGVLTERDDIQKPLKYYLQWGDTAADGEEYEPDEITHFRRNVKRSIKRGLTDFSFDTLDALDLAGRLRTNLGDAAAQQASIVGVREHTGGTQAEITAFVEGDKDFDTRDQLTGTATPTRRFRRGGWEDMPDGMQYVNGPIAQSQPIHLQVLQSLLRSAGVRWNAPEWLPSADASGSNYAQSLTAESPFVKTVLRRQRAYKSAFTRTMWVVLTNAAKAGKIYAAGRAWTIEEIRREIDILTEAVSPETRNKLQEAQTASIEVPLGVDSRQRYAQSQGRDWDQIQQDNEQYISETGGAGAGLPLPGQGDPFGGGPSIGGPPRNALGESLFESTDEMLESREGLVKKIITDKNGVKRTVYVRSGGEEVGLKKGSGTTDKSSQNRRPTIEETLEHVNRLRSDMTPEGLKEFAQTIRGHTVAELREIKLKLGLKASGLKAEYADKIAYRAVNGMPVKITVPTKPKMGKAYNVSPDEIIADPNRFQFKLNTSGPSGTGDELKGIGKWNADLAGVISVWKDPADGKTYVVNGHHRLELSKRLKAGKIAVRYLDAGSATEARGKGALINIAEGRGTAVDAAKFMRDTGTTVDDFANEGVSLRGKVAADAATLTALSDPLFSRVARGSLDTDRAIAIASNLPDHDAQAALVEHIEKQEDRTGREYSPKVVAEAAKEAAITAKTTEKTSNLFGDEENEKSLVMPRAELKAHIRGELSKEIRDYQAVASQRRADRVSGEGNILNISANKAAADKAENAADTFNRLSGYKGELSDILNEEAVHYDAAKSQKDREAIRKRTLERVRAALPKVEQDAIQGLGGGA